MTILDQSAGDAVVITNGDNMLPRYPAAALFVMTSGTPVLVTDAEFRRQQQKLFNSNTGGANPSDATVLAACATVTLVGATAGTVIPIKVVAVKNASSGTYAGLYP